MIILNCSALTLLRTGEYGKIGGVLSALSKALDSNDRYVRAYAFKALSYLRTGEAVDVLLRYYQTARRCPDTKNPACSDCEDAA